MHVTRTTVMGVAAVFILSGCAVSPTERVASQKVRVCTQDGGCRDKDKAEIRAQPIEAPLTEQERQEEAKIKSLEEKASGDPRAAFDLALRFFRGDGVGRDSRKAFVWMERAAEAGHAPAQLALGRLYLTGFEEMGADPAAAESWLSAAAGKGDEEAKTLLAQAQEAKRSDAAWRRWVGAWRPTWLGYWWRGYGYYLYWADRAWYYY